MVKFRPSDIVDFVVIGSGAAGGMVTKTLCEAGAKVILLEAGKEVKPGEFKSHCWPYELQFRNLRRPAFGASRVGAAAVEEPHAAALALPLRAERCIGHQESFRLSRGIVP